MSQHEVILRGCTPEPLISYLKALGILRLISLQADSDARGAWHNDTFILRSSLDENAIANFFLTRYQPTPILAPWGARSGFYKADSEKAAREALQRILAAEGDRFRLLQKGIQSVRDLLRELGISEKAKDEDKLALLVECRDRLPEEFLSWLDACYVLTADDRKFPPLLGTGGNEGSGSYVSGFAQQVVACLVDRGHDDALRHALFGEPAEGITGGQMPGHFSPGDTGGANAGQGFTGPLTTNRWDYVLCIEGTCLWASGVVRKLGRPGRSVAAFPFTVNVSGAGSGSLSARDGRKPKQAKREVAEMWLPLWGRFMTLRELSALLSEGRASVGRRMADNGLDFARAASSLGVDRGITAFERVAFLMRNGQSFMGMSMGRFPVRARARADLLREADAWLYSYRAACGDKAPGRFVSALRDIDRAIFDYCRYGGTTLFQAILIAFGAAERELSRGESFRIDRKNDRVRVRPLNGLSPAWIGATEDHTAECEIALALASVFDAFNKVGPLRANLEPFDWQNSTWAKASRSVVWQSAHLSANLAAVLERRMLDGMRRQCERLPLAFNSPASLNSVADFLASDVEDGRIDSLLWAFLPVDIPERPVQRIERVIAPPLPRAYALLKLCFLPFPIEIHGVEHEVSPEPAILPLLVSDRLKEACDIALRRLRVSGLRPLGDSRAGSARRDTAAAFSEGCAVSGQRLAASLLIPISTSAVTSLCRAVLRLESPEEEANNLALKL